jgi:8-oxo-dGTP diphosphatase
MEEIIKVFGNKLRLRVGGICIKNDKILLVKHINLGEHGILWSPPGGGMNFDETVNDALQREFLEETGLEIEIQKLLFINEFNQSPLHAVELFFMVNEKAGTLKTGRDPEMELESQIIIEVAYLSIDQIKTGDPGQFHALFANVESINDLKEMKGYHLNGKFLG